MKEIPEQARAVIFVVLSLALFLLWSRFFYPTTPNVTQTGQTAATSQSSPAPVSRPATPAAMVAAPAPVPALQASAEKTLVVEGPQVYRVELSNRGGVARSWQLQKYSVDLVNKESAQELGWPLSLVLNDPNLEAEANSALYQITPAAEQLTAPAEVTMQWSDGHLSVVKKIGFAKNYEVHLDVSVLLDGKPIPFSVAWRGEFGDKEVYQAAQLVTVFYSQNSKLSLLQYKNLGFPTNRILPYNQGGPIDFAGLEDQFFAAAFLPSGTDASLSHWTQWHHYTGTDSQKSPDPEPQISVGPLNPGPLAVRLFVGPKDLEVLRQQNPSLEGLINFGWFAFIAKPILFGLQWMHRYIPNYGWVIVVFTILLNMALFPVKIWTFRSMRKMQLVAPEIKSIQDRYKKYSMRDPRKQKMNEEIMAVYQREGVNPVGSCLPMLVQLPLIYAFYRVLAYSIELRHAPWFGWIHDLSARDPYYLIPVAMAVTMYFSQKMTPMPATVDPAQQRMMMFMPVMMTFIMYRLASGLNLYYLTVNVVGVAQQWYLNRMHPMPSRSKFKKNKE